MKRIIIITVLLITSLPIYAQVAVGKDTVDGAGILDFASGTTNGIILPVVETLPTTAADGTFLMDKSDLKIKVRENGAWVDLSDPGSLAGATVHTGPDVGQGVIIGADTSAAEGVLVLEATDKALILPKVADPHLNVKSPYPGMICYDTVSKTMALFDGLKWNYWK